MKSKVCFRFAAGGYSSVTMRCGALSSRCMLTLTFSPRTNAALIVIEIKPWLTRSAMHFIRECPGRVRLPRISFFTQAPQDHARLKARYYALSQLAGQMIGSGAPLGVPYNGSNLLIFQRRRGVLALPTVPALTSSASSILATRSRFRRSPRRRNQIQRLGGTS